MFLGCRACVDAVSTRGRPFLREEMPDIAVVLLDENGQGPGREELRLRDARAAVPIISGERLAFEAVLTSSLWHAVIGRTNNPCHGSPSQSVALHMMVGCNSRCEHLG